MKKRANVHRALPRAMIPAKNQSDFFRELDFEGVGQDFVRSSSEALFWASKPPSHASFSRRIVVVFPASLRVS